MVFFRYSFLAILFYTFFCILQCNLSLWPSDLCSEYFQRRRSSYLYYPMNDFFLSHKCNRYKYGFMNYLNLRSFSIINKTESSVYLKWKKGNDDNSENNIFYNIKYKGDEKDWNSIICDENDLTLFNEELALNITGLHPNIRYEFRLFTKTTTNTEDGWSYLDSIFVTTQDWVPYTSPITDIGSFRVENVNDINRTVRIFWQPVPPVEHNGFGFHYTIKIFEEDNFLDEISWIENSQLVKKLSLKAHRIIIRSANYKGISENSSIVNIPAQKDLIQKPTFIKLDRGNEIYEFAWKLQNSDDITGITIVKCESETSTCGTIKEYIHLSTNETNYLKTFELHSTTAIIVNSATSTSGMHEPISETKIENLGEMSASPEFNVYDTFIKFMWPLSYPEHGIVKGVQGYDIFICEVKNNNSCAHDENKLFIRDDRTILYAFIPELDPDNLYKISANVIMADGRGGPRSGDVYVKTSVKTQSHLDTDYL
ncbi:hypothetical protein PGB90_000435 [Kerria lacca]